MSTSAALPKPRVKALSASQFVVTHRGQTGRVYLDERSGRWCACREGRDSLESIFRVMYRSEDAFAALVERLDEVADCHELAVVVDKTEGEGLHKRLAELGGADTVAVFVAALKKVHAEDVSGIPTVRGMIKVAAKKRLPKPVEAVVSDYSKRAYSVRVVAGFSVSVNGIVYFVGQQAEYDSYNLHYLGTIQNITAKTITICEDRSSGKCRRLTLDAFAWRNASEVSSKVERNSDTLMYI